MPMHENAGQIRRLFIERIIHRHDWHVAMYNALCYPPRDETTPRVVYITLLAAALWFAWRFGYLLID